jgi:hypothetical protein
MCFAAFVCFLLFIGITASVMAQNEELYTYKRTQSTAIKSFWTTPPS